MALGGALLTGVAAFGGLAVAGLVVGALAGEKLLSPLVGAQAKATGYVAGLLLGGNSGPEDGTTTIETTAKPSEPSKE